MSDLEKTEFNSLLLRTFSRRIGKTLSAIQKNMLDNKLPTFLFDENIFANQTNAGIILEIGIGMGEHFINQAKLNPNNLFIGAEVYLNGVANALKIAEKDNINNFKLWPNDIDMIIDKIPNNSLSGIYILFPDPWPKRKQNKKRMLNETRFNLFKDKLHPNGFFTFATDIDDYFSQVFNLITQDNNFKIANYNFLQPHAGYVKTKYNEKAIQAGRQAQFITAVKISSKQLLD